MTHTLDIANQVVVFVIFAASLNLLMGFAGQASIAHAAFGAVGGYTAALFSIHTGVPFLVVLVIALVVGFVSGAVVSMPALRLAEEYLILLTLAVAYIVIAVASGLQPLGAQYGLQGLKPISIFGRELNSPGEIFPLFLVLGLLALAFAWRVGQSPFGRVLKGVREDDDATRSLGHSTFRYKTLIFALTSAMAALAGAMFVYYYQQVSPRQFGTDQAIAMIAMVVLGGSGNLLGSVLGAAIVVSSTPVLQNVVNLDPTDASFVRLAIYGALLVLLMVFRPSGLLPEFRRTTRIARGTTGGGGGSSAGHAGPAGPTGDSQVPRQPGSGSAPLDRAPVPAAAGAVAEGGGDRRPARSEPVSSPSVATAAAALEVPTTGILTVRGLHKSFGGIKAVQGVDLVLPEGEVTALIGPNGAGKSTIFGLITGFITPDQGDVRLRGQDILGKSPQEISRLGMVRSFQDVRLFRRMTVLENAMFGVPGNVGVRLRTLLVDPVGSAQAERRARDTAMEALETVGLAGKADLVAGGLGHGEQKLAAIARILATGADVMLLDEPTSGVDPRWVERVAETIRGLPQLGKTVCIVEHNLGFLEQIGAPCYFLEAGVVRKKGTLRDLMADTELRQAYFGV